MVAEYCDVFAALLNNFLLMGKVLLKFVGGCCRTTLIKACEI